MNQKGFTLIEVMVAVVIISVLAVTVTQVMSRAEATVDVSRETFVAVNIAREGLELVRSVRDSNWFADDDRTLWLQQGLCDDSSQSYLDDDRQFTLDAEGVRNNSGVGSVADAALYIDEDGGWTHARMSEKTPYERVIHIDCSTKINNPPYVTVTAEVLWRSRGQDRNVTLREKLYNWLPSDAQPEVLECEQELVPIREYRNRLQDLFPSRNIFDINTVVIHEKTGSVTPIEMIPLDPRLITDISERPGIADWITLPPSLEHYDFFYSDAAGNFDLNGSYITIEAFRGGLFSNDQVGNNIDAVELKFDNDSAFYADIISSYELGTGLSGEYLNSNGFAQAALGPADDQTTFMGDGNSRITVGFCDALKQE